MQRAIALMEREANLWCGIVGTPTGGLQEVAISHHIAQSKVSYFHIHLAVQQQILHTI